MSIIFLWKSRAKRSFWVYWKVIDSTVVGVIYLFLLSRILICVDVPVFSQGLARNTPQEDSQDLLSTKFEASMVFSFGQKGSQVLHV